MVHHSIMINICYFVCLPWNWQALFYVRAQTGTLLYYKELYTGILICPATNICLQVVRGFSHGRWQAGAAGGQCGEGHRLPEAWTPGHADRPAAGDHTPEEALSWSVYCWPAPLHLSMCLLTTWLPVCLSVTLSYCFFLSVCPVVHLLLLSAELSCELDSRFPDRNTAGKILQLLADGG